MRGEHGGYVTKCLPSGRVAWEKTPASAGGDKGISVCWTGRRVDSPAGDGSGSMEDGGRWEDDRDEETGIHSAMPRAGLPLRLRNPEPREGGAYLSLRVRFKIGVNCRQGKISAHRFICWAVGMKRPGTILPYPALGFPSG